MWRWKWGAGEAAKAPLVTPLMAHLTDTTAADPTPPPPPLRAARKQKELPPTKKGRGAAAAEAPGRNSSSSSKGRPLKDDGPGGTFPGKGRKSKEEGAPVKSSKASKQVAPFPVPPGHHHITPQLLGSIAQITGRHAVATCFCISLSLP